MNPQGAGQLVGAIGRRGPRGWDGVARVRTMSSSSTDGAYCLGGGQGVLVTALRRVNGVRPPPFRPAWPEVAPG